MSTLPISTVFYGVNGTKRYSKLSGQRSDCGSKFKFSFNIPRSAFGKLESFSAHMRNAASAFFVHVPHVVHMCSQPKVIGIHAGRVISPRTVMQDQQTRRDRAEMDDPGESVSENQRAGMPSDTDVAITSPLTGSCPQPAGICFINLDPKSFQQAVRDSDNQFFNHVNRGGLDLFTKQSRPLPLKNGKGEVYA